ncbi:MAG: N-acetyl sugar amidotransferase [Acidobacteriota bacterium]|nr:N-acetyl sugar amidotransferase [Acidobacteriota bacterium]
MSARAYQQCTRCVMDTSAADITFDEGGLCSYCTAFVTKLQSAALSPADRPARLDEFVRRVKAGGVGKDYDCVVGVSGGVDSSYALYQAVHHGLRPLAVHLDNGWNSELASHNIANLVNELGVDLYTHVIDWEENRDLQLSFFKANVVDIELLMDNAMLALNYRQAAKHGLKYMLTGSNAVSEGIAIPAGWNHYKYDVRNIRRIHRQFGHVPIRTHPLLSTLEAVWYEAVKGIKWISFLDYFPYNKFEAVETLKAAVGYKPYPYKHYESVFTRFYQAYILPRKFGFDKRRPHLSALVVSGQMTREAALQALTTPPYPDPNQEEQDRIFVMKKLGMSEDQFALYMQAPAISHGCYGSEQWLKESVVRAAKAIGFKR